MKTAFFNNPLVVQILLNPLIDVSTLFSMLETENKKPYYYLIRMIIKVFDCTVLAFDSCNILPDICQQRLVVWLPGRGNYALTFMTYKAGHWGVI